LLYSDKYSPPICCCILTKLSPTNYYCISTHCVACEFETVPNTLSFIRLLGERWGAQKCSFIPKPWTMKTWEMLDAYTNTPCYRMPINHSFFHLPPWISTQLLGLMNLVYLSSTRSSCQIFLPNSTPKIHRQIFS